MVVGALCILSKFVYFIYFLFFFERLFAIIVFKRPGLCSDLPLLCSLSFTGCLSPASLMSSGGSEPHLLSSVQKNVFDRVSLDPNCPQAKFILSGKEAAFLFF